jgi:hypothetical protein
MQRLAVALAGLCVLAAGCGANSGQANPTVSGPATAPRIAEPALPGLLLDATQVNAALGATDLAVSNDAKDMTDHGASVSREECLAIFGPGEAKAYVGSGWNTFREQQLADPARTRWAVQSVVLFPTAEQAAAFFTASSTKWRKCDGSFVNSLSGGREVWDVGSVSEVDGMLSVTTTSHLEVDDKPAQQNSGSAGQRALTVRNNIVIDIAASSSGPNDPAAVKIADQIAAKVPKA